MRVVGRPTPAYRRLRTRRVSASPTLGDAEARPTELDRWRCVVLDLVFVLVTVVAFGLLWAVLRGVERM